MSNDSCAQNPSRHDGVTTCCPACGQPFIAAGRQRWCSGACRAAGYRRRKQTATPPLALAAPIPRRPSTVYECDSCSTRSLGSQRCEECGAFTRRVGIGGCCPHCDEPVTINDLIGPELARLT
jgi:hypothetical protein